VSSFISHRRFYLSKRIAARLEGMHALESLWRGKQEAEPATPLPEDFPHRTELEAHGYTAQEDLVGADECELVEWVELSVRAAKAVLAAHAAL
jgi:hypothetical protein